MYCALPIVGDHFPLLLSALIPNIGYASLTSNLNWNDCRRLHEDRRPEPFFHIVPIPLCQSFIHVLISHYPYVFYHMRTLNRHSRQPSLSSWTQKHIPFSTDTSTLHTTWALQNTQSSLRYSYTRDNTIKLTPPNFYSYTRANPSSLNWRLHDEKNLFT